MLCQWVVVAGLRYTGFIVIRITIVVQNTTLCFVIVIVKSQDKDGADENVGVYPKKKGNLGALISIGGMRVYADYNHSSHYVG